MGLFNKIDKFADRICSGSHYTAMVNRIQVCEDKLYRTDERKRVFIPRALPRGLKKAGIELLGVEIAMIRDCVARAKAFQRDEQNSKAQKLRKWAVLPIKLTGLALLELTAVIIFPIYLVHGVKCAIKGLIHYKNSI